MYLKKVGTTQLRSRPDWVRHVATAASLAVAAGRGEMFVLASAEEAYGDLVVAASFASPEAINAMARHARGRCLSGWRVGLVTAAYYG